MTTVETTRERGSKGVRARGLLSEIKGEFAEWIIEVAGERRGWNSKAATSDYC